MKIAHVVCTFPPYQGGMGNSTYRAAIEMARRGHEITVFTPLYNRDLPQQETIEDRLTVVRLAPLFTIGNAAVLLQLVWKLRRFDIVHLHYPFYGSCELTILGILFGRAKLIFHYHMDPVVKGVKGMIFSLYAFFCLPVLLRLADGIICASLDYIKHSEAGAYYLVHKEKFIQIPFGVDTENFRPSDEPKSLTIVFVGGLDKPHYFKGVPQLISAFRKVATAVPESQLLLIGKGGLENKYQALITEGDLRNRVRILNSVSDEELAGYYRRASVLTLPSVNRGEAFGIVLLEAMACGTPVVASNLPGVRNVFHNGLHGYLVKAGDVEGLAEKLIFLLKHPDIVASMGKEARAWTEKEYSWPGVAARLDAAYCRILYSPVTDPAQHQLED